MDNLPATLIPQAEIFKFGQAIHLYEICETVVIRIQHAKVEHSSNIEIVQLISTDMQNVESRHRDMYRQVTQGIM